MGILPPSKRQEFPNWNWSSRNWNEFAWNEVYNATRITPKKSIETPRLFTIFTWWKRETQAQNKRINTNKKRVDIAVSLHISNVLKCTSILSPLSLLPVFSAALNKHSIQHDATSCKHIQYAIVNLTITFISPCSFFVCCFSVVVLSTCESRWWLLSAHFVSDSYCSLFSSSIPCRLYQTVVVSTGERSILS